MIHSERRDQLRACIIGMLEIGDCYWRPQVVLAAREWLNDVEHWQEGDDPPTPPSGWIP